MLDFTDKHEAVFKLVQHMPVGKIKALEYGQLNELRSLLIKEVREVGRALQWVDGVISIKIHEETRNEK